MHSNTLWKSGRNWVDWSFVLPKCMGSTSIISDQDSCFLGKFWSSLWELMDTKMKKITTFHPQTSGQTKVVNWTMVHLLWGYCAKHPKIWDEQLHYAQHAYNRSIHSSTQKSPFETCFGYLPKYPIEFFFGKDMVECTKKDADKARKFIQLIYLIH